MISLNGNLAIKTLEMVGNVHALGETSAITRVSVEYGFGWVRELTPVAKHFTQLGYFVLIEVIDVTTPYISISLYKKMNWFWRLVYLIMPEKRLYAPVAQLGNI